MTHQEVIYRLQLAGYVPDLYGSPDTFWNHPSGKMTVKVKHDGHVVVWYYQHPKYYCWESSTKQFYIRRPCQ